MKVSIKATNLKLTPEIKKAIEVKIATLDKFISHLDPSSVKVFVEVTLETRHHKKGEIYYAEANIKVPGKIIRSEAEGEDIYQTIDEVKDELQALLKKYKKRKSAKRKRAGRALKRKTRFSSLIKEEEKGKRIRQE